jgi:anti-sigma factor ChrR (cupin superfamily)
MSEDLDQTAASYVLGIARGAARAAIEARLAGERGSQTQDSQTRALLTKVKLWQENFAALDLTATPEHPPEGVFDRILAGLDAEAKEIPGTLTRRAGTGVWREMSPGVTYQVLFEDPIAKRRSILVRALPGAIYEPHVHDEGQEECLVLEGDLTMGDLKLLPGDFHLAAKGSAHPPATTITGCLLYLSTAYS